MNREPSRKLFKASCFVTLIGIILTVVSIATPEWTYAGGVHIGLWTITVEGGSTYMWTGTGEYEDFFYSTWFSAVRGMMMAAVITSALGILFNFYVLAKHKTSSTVANVLTLYYSLAFALVITSTAVYSCLIAQGVDVDGKITAIKDLIVQYIYIGGYGYSLWIGWVASGMFLLSSALAYEASNQEIKAKKMLDFIHS